MQQIISRNPLFAGMTEAEAEQALSVLSASKSEYPRNAILVSAGGEMHRFGLILSGTVQVCFTDIDGNEVLMASVSEGESFGESLCWLGEKDIPVTVRAFTDISILWLSTDKLKSESTKAAQDLRNRFCSMLAHKTLAMNDRVQILSKPSIRQKLITFLSQTAAHSGSKTFQIPFDRETLALYLGVNRSALSRELSAMQADGIIQFYKNSFKILK